MGDVSDEDHHRIMTDDELMELYEQLRAAGKNPSRGYPFADQTMKVDIDWDALERRALRPSLPERARAALIAIPPRVLAASIVLPVAGLLATFFWLRDVPVGFTEEFAVSTATGAAFMVLMFMWSAISMQAMERVVRADAREAVLRESALATPAPAGKPAFQPIRLLGSPHVASFTFFATSALVITGAVVIAARFNREPQTARHDPAEERNKEAAVLFVRDDLQGGSDRVGEVLDHTGPSRNRKAFYTAADLAYEELMALPGRAPDADKLREQLTDQALKSLLSVKRANPKSAAVWTRLAEVYFLKGNIDKARESLEKVKKLDDVPPLETARAQMIAGFIDARDISTQLRTAPSQQRTMLASRLDEAIGGIQKSSKAAGADASVVLTHLYLARAEATDDPREREKRHDEAFARSLEAINAATVLKAVERPQSLTRELGLAPETSEPRIATPEPEPHVQ